MNKTVQRYLWCMLGVILNAYGVVLIAKGDFGATAVTSVSYVLSLRFAPTMGQFAFGVNLAMIAVQVILLRRDFEPVQVLQLAVNVVFSGFVDVAWLTLAVFEPQGFAARVFALLAGCVTLGVGISIEVAPQVVYAPAEGMVAALHRVLGGRFGTVKVASDVTMAVIAIALSVVFFGRVTGIGVGTVVSALLVGRVVNFSNRYFPLIPHIARLAPVRDKRTE